MPTETLTKNQYLLQRVTKIVTSLIAEEQLYQERLNIQEMINLMYHLFSDRQAVSDIDILSDTDLISRINGILIVHAVAGTLNDLTHEQLAIFNEIVGD